MKFICPELFKSTLIPASDSFSNILNEHGLDENLIKNIDWFNPDLKNKLSRKDQEKIEKIMLSWFHPLKNEWYPYLHNLKKGDNL